MSELHDLLMREVERQPPVTPPPFENLAARARRRRTLASAGSVAGAVVVTAAIVIPIFVARPESGPAQTVGPTSNPSPAPSSSAEPLISSGNCAGLTITAAHSGNQMPLSPESGANRIVLDVGEMLSLTATGPCADAVAYSTQPGSVLTPADIVPTAPESTTPTSTTTTLTARQPGSGQLDVTMSMCAQGTLGSACRGGIWSPATVTITVVASSATALPSDETALEEFQNKASSVSNLLIEAGKQDPDFDAIAFDFPNRALDVYRKSGKPDARYTEIADSHGVTLLFHTSLMTATERSATMAALMAAQAEFAQAGVSLTGVEAGLAGPVTVDVAAISSQALSIAASHALYGANTVQVQVMAAPIANGLVA